MSSVSRTWARSSVGKKAISAASGLVLLGFVLAHMLANLQIFAGAARIDGLRARRCAPRRSCSGRCGRCWWRRSGSTWWSRCSSRPCKRGAPGPRTVSAALAQRRRIRRRARMLATGLVLAVFVRRAPRQPDLGHLAPALRAAGASTTTWSRCSGSGPGARFYAVALVALATARGARRLERAAIARLTARRGAPGLAAPRARRGGCHCDGASSRSWSPCSWEWCDERRAHARRAHPGRCARVEVGHLQGRRAAGQPGQPPPLRASSSSAPGSRAPRPPRRWPSSATTSPASASRTARGARTASPPRAASTPPRTTRTTATA